jgi:hypothetical protein
LADGKVETWYEAAELPGKLRIDIAPLEGKNTLLFRNDSLYEFKGGKLAESRPMVHPLMVLGFDVYAQPVDVTVRQLRSLGFDLGKLHESTWQGRPAYVVGAAAGDTVTRQFWIDKERLYFVRMVEPGKQAVGQGRDALQQVHPDGAGVARDGGAVPGERGDQDAGGIQGAEGRRTVEPRHLRAQPLDSAGLGPLTGGAFQVSSRSVSATSWYRPHQATVTLRRPPG